MQKRNILVTSALPYANGPIHLGHLVEHIQVDVWVRFHKSRGENCYFICGDDAHGTPIMISAQRQNITPEQLIEKIHAEHIRDFAGFFIGFDYYYSTHSKENEEFSSFIYKRLRERGDIVARVIKQSFDPVQNIFLPDRYVKGECPRCGAHDQYGDNCEVCGATYSPGELKNPISILSGAKPIEKESEHYFFCLENYHAMLERWLKEGHVQTQMVNKLLEWFKTGLQQWDISRDAPYFGFEIPDAPGKYFYVWLDAPVGYMASFKKLCEHENLDFDAYWKKNTETELYHFIGKDIVYFHALFWPAMLEGSGFRLPTEIFTHGFVTINGQKMSKSRGTFITAEHYLKYLNPEHLRYYFAAKLRNGIDDIDLNFEDFMQRVNADLIGKVINIASRCAGFITKFFDGKLAAQLAKPSIYENYIAAADLIAEHYTNRDYNQAVREIMNLADQANQYIDEMKPWSLTKDEETLSDVQLISSMGLNLFRVLMIYLQPILPETSKRVLTFLNVKSLDWNTLSQPLLNHRIGVYEPLMFRVDATKVAELLSSNNKSDEKNLVMQ